MKSPRVPIAVEGYPFILFSGFTALIFAMLELVYVAVPALLITGFITWFFRDPDRITPEGDNLVVSPADGKVIFAETIEDERFGLGQTQKISIFMNVFNVHVNRFPYGGRVEQVTLHPGKFYSADSPRGALQNEFCAMTVAADNLQYRVVQVAGLIARRIVCWARKEDELQTGERYGLIRFGSRVDLYLPPQVKLNVNRGDIVRAGETIIAHVPGPTS